MPNPTSAHGPSDLTLCICRCVRGSSATLQSSSPMTTNLLLSWKTCSRRSLYNTCAVCPQKPATEAICPSTHLGPAQAELHWHQCVADPQLSFCLSSMCSEHSSARQQPPPTEQQCSCASCNRLRLGPQAHERPCPQRMVLPPCTSGE